METRLAASQYYGDLLEEARLEGLMSESEALTILRRRWIWTSDSESQYQLLTKKIDDLKVGLYENWTHSNNRFLIREALSKGKAELSRLDEVKHSLDHVTCEGVAAAGKIRYLTGFSLIYEDGRPFWTSEEDLNNPDGVVDLVIEWLVKTRLTESDVRDICKNDPWRSYWATRKLSGRGFIDLAAIDLTDEQRYVMMWANVYDSIRDSPDCPDDSIIEDDDMLDGWMIKQRRERDKQRASKRGEEITNSKIRNADEVYLMADTVDDARKIDKLNDNISKTIKSQRMAHLKNKGVVSEMEMPDTWSRFQQEASQAAAKAIKGG
jgi:hypothetical protein